MLAGLDAVAVFRLARAPNPVDRIEAQAAASLSIYAGRAVELETVVALVVGARLGEGGLVTVAGEAGAGKTRLLHELRARLLAKGSDAPPIASSSVTVIRWARTFPTCHSSRCCVT